MKVFSDSTPARNLDGSTPKPWRVAHANVLKDMLASAGYPNSIAYVEYERDASNGKKQLWVGLRDNRDVHKHELALKALAAKMRGWRIGKVTLIYSGDHHVIGIRVTDTASPRKRKNPYDPHDYWLSQGKVTLTHVTRSAPFSYGDRRGLRSYIAHFSDGSTSTVGPGVIGNSATDAEVRRYFRNILVDKNKEALGLRNPRARRSH